MQEEILECLETARTLVEQLEALKEEDLSSLSVESEEYLERAIDFANDAESMLSFFE